MICFSPLFDETAVDSLESLDVPAYKIASFENTRLPLIRKTTSMGKPLLISTGMAAEDKITDALKGAISGGSKDVLLFKCTGTCPADPTNTNIRTIPHMVAHQFGGPVGPSDHTMGIGVAVGAVALGAVAIDQHFTLRRSNDSVDAAFFIERNALAALVVETKRAWQSLRAVTYGPAGRENKSLQSRELAYVVRNVLPGELLAEVNVRDIRPEPGLTPK